MEFNDVRTAVTAKGKGTVRTMEYSKALKTRKDVTDIVTKTTKMQCRYGCKYDNLGNVKEARETGALPTENQGLPKNTEWMEYPYFIKNINTGAIQLRCSLFDGNKTETQYYKNGVPCEKADIEALVLKNELPQPLKEGAVKPSIINIGIDKINSIK